jgi:hypothetical protein
MDTRRSRRRRVQLDMSLLYPSLDKLTSDARLQKVHHDARRSQVANLIWSTGTRTGVISLYRGNGLALPGIVGDR